jgi:cytosine/uracil/thiamine/allantoin permease
MTEIAVESPAVDATPKPFGPAAAVILAAGIGSFALGLLTVLNEASAGVHDALEFDTGVGPLSGKTSVTMMAFFFSWAVLSLILWRRDVRVKPVLWIAGVLIALGLLGTFPEFFEQFAD